MKKVYERPMMICDRFAVDEYCAMCGDVEKEYYFQCNEDPGFFGIVYGNDGSVIASSYDDCGAGHPLTEDELDDLLSGYVIKYTEDSGLLPDRVPVLIWRGESGTNCHCTTNVNVETWEVNLS